MTTLALLLSFTSMALAAILLVVVLRMRRDERRRSDARVAALARMAADDFLPEPEPAVAVAPVAASASLFATPASPAAWSSPLTIAGTLGLIVLVLFVGALFRTPAGAGTATAAGSEPRLATDPLELLALGHVQEGARLTVSGTVRNPRGGQPVSSLTATVFLFASDGSFLTSGRAPLDVSPLAPGARSTFTVTIPVKGAVARYRVSFRDRAGRAVAHADRRTAAIARSQPGQQL
jgi:hypothetical protein